MCKFKECIALLTILSATDTYNYALAKWLDEKLKPLTINEYTISHIFHFSEEIQHLQIGNNDFLVSYDVTALFTTVPLEETIQILAKKAFNGNWFNNTRNLNICEGDLIEHNCLQLQPKISFSSLSATCTSK